MLTKMYGSSLGVFLECFIVVLPFPCPFNKRAIFTRYFQMQKPKTIQTPEELNSFPGPAPWMSLYRNRCLGRRGQIRFILRYRRTLRNAREEETHIQTAYAAHAIATQVQG